MTGELDDGTIGFNAVDAVAAAAAAAAAAVASDWARACSLAELNGLRCDPTRCTSNMVTPSSISTAPSPAAVLEEADGEDERMSSRNGAFFKRWRSTFRNKVRN